MSCKNEFLKSKTKKALFRCFGQQFRKTIVIFEVSALKFVLSQNLVQKLKSLNFESKMLYLGIFWLEFSKIIVVFDEISTIEFVKSKFLIQTVIFGIGSAFSECPGQSP